jgi:hypothetical protein
MTHRPFPMSPAFVASPTPLTSQGNQQQRAASTGDRARVGAEPRPADTRTRSGSLPRPTGPGRGALVDRAWQRNRHDRACGCQPRGSDRVQRTSYVIRGTVRVGQDFTLLKIGQVGWLDRPEAEGTSVASVAAGEDGPRVVLYAGQPQGDAIVSHGPFIGDSGERRRQALYRVPSWPSRTDERSRP